MHSKDDRRLLFCDTARRLYAVGMPAWDNDAMNGVEGARTFQTSGSAYDRFMTGPNDVDTVTSHLITAQDVAEQLSPALNKIH